MSFLVHHEPTIDERDEVRRHVTVLVLTPSRLILAHTDEHAPDDLLPAPYTSTSTEAITLSAIRSVVVNRMVANPSRTPAADPARRQRGGADHRLGRRRPDRPRAGRLRGPRVRGRPRLHRRCWPPTTSRCASAPPPTGPRRSPTCSASPTRSPARTAAMSDAFVEPAYEDRSLGDVLPAVAARPRRRRRAAADRRSSCPRPAAYVVFLVDGLGYELLRDHADAGAVPARRCWTGRPPATAGVPSTTATSLTSLGTGADARAPTAWSASPRGSPAPTGCSTRCSGSKDVDPREWQPHPTAFEPARGRRRARRPSSTSGSSRGSGLTVAGARAARSSSAPTGSASGWPRRVAAVARRARR